MVLACQAVIYRRLEDQQHDGWVFARILPEMRFRPLEQKAVASFEGISLPIDAYLELTSDAMNKLLTRVTDRGRGAVASWFYRVKEWLQLLPG